MKFSAEQRARAVRLVAEATPQHESEWAAIESVRGEDRRFGGDGARVGAPGGGRRRAAPGADQ